MRPFEGHFKGSKSFNPFPSSGYTYSKDYYKTGGYICPSDIFYGRPKRAINTYGQWKVIVNLVNEKATVVYRVVQKGRFRFCTGRHKSQFMFLLQPDEYYAKGYGKGYEKYTQTQRLEQCM